MRFFEYYLFKRHLFVRNFRNRKTTSFTDEIGIPLDSNQRKLTVVYLGIF